MEFEGVSDSRLFGWLALEDEQLVDFLFVHD